MDQKWNGNYPILKNALLLRMLSRNLLEALNDLVTELSLPGNAHKND